MFAKDCGKEAWSSRALVQTKVRLKREQWVTHASTLQTRGSADTTAPYTKNNVWQY